MKKLEFRASELVINEKDGVHYLNIRSAGNPALIEEARSMGVREYEEIQHDFEDNEE